VCGCDIEPAHNFCTRVHLNELSIVDTHCINNPIIGIRLLHIRRVKHSIANLTAKYSSKHGHDEEHTSALGARDSGFSSLARWRTCSHRAIHHASRGCAAARIHRYALADSGEQTIIIAGETSIMDADDITPRGIKQAGGAIQLYGAPVEPGNLLLIAYCGDVLIIGAPGCIKSHKTNAVDLILLR
jgi:hypothetical protein